MTYGLPQYDLLRNLHFEQNREYAVNLDATLAVPAKSPKLAFRALLDGITYTLLAMYTSLVFYAGMLS